MKVVDQEKVKSYILRLIKSGRKDYIKAAIESFNISKSSVYNYVKQMEADDLILKKDGAYVLKTSFYHYFFKNDGTLGEDRVYSQFISQHIQFKKNVNSIWNYAFTEMMNNAIEHSEAENISVGILETLPTELLLIISIITVLNVPVKCYLPKISPLRKSLYLVVLMTKVTL